MVTVRGTQSTSNKPKMPKKSQVMATRPVLRHWCRAPRIRGCGMVLISTGRNRFTTAGFCLRSDSGWSWTFRIARMTLHDCEVAPLISQTFARAIFFAAWPSSCSNFDLGPSPLDSTIKYLWDQSLWFGVQFSSSERIAVFADSLNVSWP